MRGFIGFRAEGLRVEIGRVRNQKPWDSSISVLFDGSLWYVGHKGQNGFEGLGFRGTHARDALRLQKQLQGLGFRVSGFRV